MSGHDSGDSGGKAAGARPEAPRAAEGVGSAATVEGGAAVVTGDRADATRLTVAPSSPSPPSSGPSPSGSPRSAASVSALVAGRVPVIGPGFHIGEYVVEHELGRGAFGTVFAGVQPVIGKRVAIKVLNPIYAVDPAIVARFVDEARVVNKIGHANIVDIFSFGELDDGRRYFVMDRLDGQPLSTLLRERGRLDLAEALEILAPVARALDAAHAAGVAHRDLKPDNIFLGRGDGGAWQPKLLDFGVAKLMDDGPSAHATETGVTVGTPAYMSPEQCVGKGVDHRADVYAFGVLAYRMLAGTLPFDAESASMMMAKHIYEQPRSPLEARPDVPPAVGEAILWMLKKDKTARPQTVLEALRALREPERAGAGKAASPAPAQGVSTTLIQSPGARRRGDEDAATSQRKRGFVLAMAAAAVVVVGAAAVHFATAKPPSPSAPVTSAPITTPIVTQAPPAAPAPTAPAALAPAAAPPLPAKVHVEVRGVPAGTTVRDDHGVLLGHAPGVVDVDRSDQPRHLVFEADDHQRRAEAIVPNRDLVLDLQLLPVERRSRRTAGAHRPAGTSADGTDAVPGKHTPRPNDLEPWH